MPELPEGPVTIMFTDVEGSTALRTSLGDAESDTLFHQHDELIRGLIEANRGHDQGAALGDGFLAVFASTRRAVTCAIEIQRALDSFNLGRSGPPLRVRIGLNTGEVAWQDGQLSGEAVHAAARVCAAGAGGQILVSDVTRQLAGTIPDVTFHDAGEFELKGFPHPWRLYDVVWVRETTAQHQQVFVGRHAELAHLRARLADAMNGRGGLVLVGGEPGVGKTTLVKQLIREAEQRGALAVFGRCYESEGTVPFSPFVEMLEQALNIMPPTLVREDMGDDASEVARLVPELRRRFPDIPDPIDLPAEQQRRYFFNAVGSFVARGSARFPLLMVMDDVHWADEPTLLLIEYMATLMPELRILGIGTYRDVELEVSRPLAAAMERMVRARVVDRLPVKRFDRSTVATMIEALAGQAPPDPVVDAIFSETEGNPFFIEEVFRHLVEEGRLMRDGQFRTDIEVDELDVPESVRLVVGRRLARLGDDAQKVLAAAAVVGRGFAFRLLEAVADTDSARLLDIVEEAEAARVILPEERDGEVHYTFAHELIRQTLLSGLSVLRRQRLHLAVAEAIERTDKRARTDRPSEIAHHLVQAGAAADPERTIEYLQISAQRAYDAAAYEEAMRALDDALSVVDSDDALRIAKLREQKGWAARALDRFDECIAIWDEVVDGYASLGLTEDAARLCWEIAYQYIWLNQFERSFAAQSRGLAICGDEDTVSRARLLGGRGALLGLAGLFEQAEQELDEGEALARRLGDEDALGSVLWGRSVSYWSNARIPEAAETGRGAVEHLRLANNQWILVDALAWAAFPLAFELHDPDGLKFALEGVELGRKLGHQGGELLAARGVAFTEFLAHGNLDQLARAATHDLERLSAIGSPWVSQSHAWWSTIHMLRGDFDQACESAELAIELEPPSAFSGVGWGLKLLASAHAGDVETCRKLLVESPVGAPPPDERLNIGRMCALFTAAEGCVVAGLHEQAAELYPMLALRVDHLPVGIFTLALAERVAAMTASAAQRWDDAVAHFDEAGRRAEALQHWVELASVNYWYGEMLIRRGMPEDTGRATAKVTAALEGFRRIGMPHHARLAEALLAR